MRLIKIRFRVYSKAKGSRRYPYIVGALTLGGWALTDDERREVLERGELEKDFVILTREEYEKLVEPPFEVYTI
ncbi:MAG: hypothetical protein QXP98_03565 [Thermoproteus sp.]